jgi:hypothetical protein
MGLTKRRILKRKMRKTHRKGGVINYGETGNENLNRMRRNYHRTQRHLYGYRTHNNNENSENNNSENENNNSENNKNNELNISIPNSLNSYEMPNNAMNSITMNEINFSKPAFTFHKEHNFGRYYQSNSVLNHIRKTKQNPQTKNKINSIKWYMPKKNSTKKNKK